MCVCVCVCVFVLPIRIMSAMGEADSTKSLHKDVAMTFLNMEFVLSKQHAPPT